MPSGPKKRKNAKKKKDVSGSLENAKVDTGNNTDHEVREEQDEESLTPKTSIRASESDDGDKALRSDECVSRSDLDAENLPCQDTELKIGFDAMVEEDKSLYSSVPSFTDQKTLSHGVNLEREENHATCEEAGDFSKIKNVGRGGDDMSLHSGYGNRSSSLQGNTEGFITSEGEVAESMVESGIPACEAESSRQTEQVTTHDPYSNFDAGSVSMTGHTSNFSVDNLSCPPQHGQDTMAWSNVQQFDQPNSDGAPKFSPELYGTCLNKELCIDSKSEVQPCTSSSTKEEVQPLSNMGTPDEDESSLVPAAEESVVLYDSVPHCLIAKSTDDTSFAGNFETVVSNGLGSLDGHKKQRDGSPDVSSGGARKMVAEADKTSVLDQPEQLFGNFSHKGHDIICLPDNFDSMVGQGDTSKNVSMGHALSSTVEEEEPADSINIPTITVIDVPETADLNGFIGDGQMAEMVNEISGGSSDLATKACARDYGVIGAGDTNATESTAEPKLLPEFENVKVADTGKPVEVFEAVEMDISSKDATSGKSQKDSSLYLGPQIRSEGTVKTVLDTTGYDGSHQDTMATSRDLGYAMSNDKLPMEALDARQETQFGSLPNLDSAELEQVDVNWGHLDQHGRRTSWKGCCGVLEWLFIRQE